MRVDHRPSPSGGIFKLTMFARNAEERHFLLKLNEAIYAGLVTCHTDDGNHEFTQLSEFKPKGTE